MPLSDNQLEIIDDRISELSALRVKIVRIRNALISKAADDIPLTSGQITGVRAAYDIWKNDLDIWRSSLS